MCEGTKYTKYALGKYWICENGCCYLTEEEYNSLKGKRPI
mgnify:CR=1 FL=1